MEKKNVQAETAQAGTAQTETVEKARTETTELGQTETMQTETVQKRTVPTGTKPTGIVQAKPTAETAQATRAPKNVVFTLDEIQAKYYSEGPEAARTTKYIERATTYVETAKTTGYVEKPRPKALVHLALKSQKGQPRMFRGLPKSLAQMTSQERKQFRQNKFRSLHGYRLRYEDTGATRPPYWSSDDEDDEDFFLRAEDLINASETEKNMTIFFKRHKNVLLAIKSLLQLTIFCIFCGMLMVLTTPLQHEAREKATEVSDIEDVEDMLI